MNRLKPTVFENPWEAVPPSDSETENDDEETVYPDPRRNPLARLNPFHWLNRDLDSDDEEELKQYLQSTDKGPPVPKFTSTGVQTTPSTSKSYPGQTTDRKILKRSPISDPEESEESCWEDEFEDPQSPQPLRQETEGTDTFVPRSPPRAWVQEEIPQSESESRDPEEEERIKRRMEFLSRPKTPHENYSNISVSEQYPPQGKPWKKYVGLVPNLLSDLSGGPILAQWARRSPRRQASSSSSEGVSPKATKGLENRGLEEVQTTSTPAVKDTDIAAEDNLGTREPEEEAGFDAFGEITPLTRSEPTDETPRTTETEPASATAAMKKAKRQSKMSDLKRTLRFDVGTRNPSYGPQPNAEEASSSRQQTYKTKSGRESKPTQFYPHGN